MPYSIVFIHIFFLDFFCLLEIYNVLNVIVNFHFYFRFFDIFLYLSLSYCKSNLSCRRSDFYHFLGSVQSALYTDFVAKFYNNFPQPVTT